MISIQPVHENEIIAPSKQSSQGNTQTCGAEFSHTTGDRSDVKRRVWILYFPIDGRWGVERISDFLKNNTTPKIDLELQQDTVVVVSRSGKVARVISVYNNKYEVRVCILKQGRFQHLASSPTDGDFREVNETFLEQYLNGAKLDQKRYAPKLLIC